MSEWLIPASIKNCLDSNLRFKLTHKLGNKRIFTSDAIKRLILEEAGYITVPPSALPSSGYVFNKYTGPGISDLPPSTAYYRNKTFDGNPLTTGTYHITNYNKNKNKELYSITIQDASSSEYISSATDDIMISISYAKGFGYQNLETIITDIVAHPSLQTVVKYYNFTVTIGNAPITLSPFNSYTDTRCKFTIPHWESSGDNLCYYGALSQMTSEANVTITIGPTVVLPFGLSNLKIDNIKTTLALHDKYLYLNSAILSTLGTISLDLSKDDRKSKFLKDVIVSKSSGAPLNAVTIKGGGIIYGGIIADPSLVTQLDIPRYNNSMSGTPRADIYPADSITQDAINSIQYWTLAGLLEINAKTIIIDNISVVGGIPRGISATQLNAYNIMVYVDPRTATITNSDFVLNTYSKGQADGLDSLCTNTFKNLYIQAIDDCFKIASNTTATNITILSGSAGGAINIGAYGYNKPIDQPVVSNIYLHELDKTNAGDGCNYAWPGPSVIFAPYYPTNSNQIIGPISIQNIYYPVQGTSTQWTATNQTPFFTGGFLSAGFDPSETLNNTSKFAIDITTDISFADISFNNYVFSNMLRNNIPNAPMTGQISVTINNQPTRFTSECSKGVPSDPPNQSWNGTGPNTAYTITYRPSCGSDNNCSKCIDLLGDNSINGGIINLWNCNSYDNQKWLWKPGTTTIKLYNDQSKCIDLPGGDPTPGNKLWLWDCNGTQNQKWLYDQNTNQIRYNADPSMCIDVPSGITTNGNQLQLWNCNS